MKITVQFSKLRRSLKLSHQITSSCVLLPGVIIIHTNVHQVVNSISKISLPKGSCHEWFRSSRQQNASYKENKSAATIWAQLTASIAQGKRQVWKRRGMSAGAQGSSNDFKQQLGKIFSPLYYHSKPSILSGNSLHYLQQADFYLQFQSLLQQWHPLTGQKYDIFPHLSMVTSSCAVRQNLIHFPCCSGWEAEFSKTSLNMKNKNNLHDIRERE